LWRVSDQASAALMRDFYLGLARGETKAEALRAGKLAMLHGGGERAHPYFWAPFLLSGDGQTPLTPTVPWWPFALGLVFLFGVAYFLVPRRR
jgi:type VI protein secretion system component VasF